VNWRNISSREAEEKYFSQGSGRDLVNRRNISPRVEEDTR
jgi:hypothetical protein